MLLNPSRLVFKVRPRTFDPLHLFGSARPAPLDYESLTAYRRQIAGFKPLTAEAERHLAQRLVVATETRWCYLASSPAVLQRLREIRTALDQDVTYFRSVLEPAAFRTRANARPHVRRLRAVLGRLLDRRSEAYIGATGSPPAAFPAPLRRTATALQSLPWSPHERATFCARFLAAEPNDSPRAAAFHTNEAVLAAAQHELLTAHLKLVVAIAWRYFRGPVPALDLIQMGNWGLRHALDNWRTHRGCAFLAHGEGGPPIEPLNRVAYDGGSDG